jgi:hypothetical protein
VATIFVAVQAKAQRIGRHQRGLRAAAITAASLAIASVVVLGAAALEREAPLYVSGATTTTSSAPALTDSGTSTTDPGDITTTVPTVPSSTESGGLTTTVPANPPSSSQSACPRIPAPSYSATVSAHHITAGVPDGWDVRIERPTVEAAGSTIHPQLHAGNFRLPESRGTLGGEAIDIMGPGDVFVALIERGQQSAGAGLYAAEGVSCDLAPNTFSDNAVISAVQGRAATQRFFTAQGRAFMLYAVLGSSVHKTELVQLVNRFLASVTIERSP